jgi:hypothetical protein
VHVAGVVGECAIKAEKQSTLVAEISNALVDLGMLPIRDIPKPPKMAQEVLAAASPNLQCLREEHASGDGPSDWTPASCYPRGPRLSCLSFFCFSLLEKLQYTYSHIIYIYVYVYVYVYILEDLCLYAPLSLGPQPQRVGVHMLSLNPGRGCPS